MYLMCVVSARLRFIAKVDAQSRTAYTILLLSMPFVRDAVLLRMMNRFQTPLILQFWYSARAHGIKKAQQVLTYWNQNTDRFVIILIYLGSHCQTFDCILSVNNRLHIFRHKECLNCVLKNSNFLDPTLSNISAKLLKKRSPHHLHIYRNPVFIFILSKILAFAGK